MGDPHSRPGAVTNPSAAQASSRLRIVVLGYIIRGPLGGMAWHHLQYVLGLKQLGHEVLFLEDSDDYPSCYDPSTHVIGTDPSYGLRFADQAFARLELADCWAYYDAHRKRWYGPASDSAMRFCRDAEVLINVSGVNPIRRWLESIPVRVLIDTDPVFTQIRHLNDQAARDRAAQYNAFFSFGELIETSDNSIPDDGLDWHATRQPVVLDAWPADEGAADGRFTTVMQWDSYPAIEFDGQRYGMKSESFDIVRRLPGRVKRPLEIALGGSSAPRQELQRLGWRLVDPLAVTRDPWTYQAYLHSSRGEFSVAKHGYIAGRSGWFSERTACYLATGRPAVVQDTGFSRHLPCGEGLWAFDTADSAKEALQQVDVNYRAQCRAARDLAAEYFDSRKVLPSLLERSATFAAKTPNANSSRVT